MQIFFYFFFFTVEELEFSLFVFLCHVPHRERPRSTGNRIYLLRLHPEVFINNILNKSCFPELITKVTKERAQCTVPIRQPLTMLQCYFFIFLKKVIFYIGRSVKLSGEWRSQSVTSQRWSVERVLCFHHSQSELEPINTRDYCRVVWMQTVPIETQSTVRCVGFCPVWKVYMIHCISCTHVAGRLLVSVCFHSNKCSALAM